MMWSYHDGWGWIWMTIAMVAFWALVVGVVVLLVRGSSGTTPRAPEGDRRASAEEILAERFARGEIDADEYRTRVDALDGAVRR